MAVLARPTTLLTSKELRLDARALARIRLATEKELSELFEDCELGAMPPFGGLIRSADVPR
jgi:prolyl-tRNA editing enzyme YbaK/EbsC (Cys-tRNA(Pro) deacylase)